MLLQQNILDNLSLEVVSFYRFKKLARFSLKSIKKSLLKEGLRLRIRGLILLSSDGINATVSGSSEDIYHYLQYIEDIMGIDDFLYKRGISSTWGFKCLRVKIKRSIITMEKGVLKMYFSIIKQKCLAGFRVALKLLQFIVPCIGCRKQQETGNISAFSLSPSEVENMLKEDVTILDIRNDYEVELGRFKRSQDLDIKEFGEFPEKLRQASLDKQKKTLIYCTGGIRCEKALKEMHRQGFEDVSLLKGGILHYLKEFPHRNFEGECFVFDQRVALDQEGRPSQRYALCPHCGQAADQKKECIHCAKLFKICKKCLSKGVLVTCSKNCAYHTQQV